MDFSLCICSLCERYKNPVDLVPMTPDVLEECKNAYRSYSVYLESQKKIKATKKV